MVRQTLKILLNHVIAEVQITFHITLDTCLILRKMSSLLLQPSYE